MKIKKISQKIKVRKVSLRKKMKISPPQKKKKD